MNTYIAGNVYRFEADDEDHAMEQYEDMMEGNGEPVDANYVIPGESIAEKCADCHLFVEPNDAVGPGIAAYIHLHRGDDADDAIDESHTPRPSGMRANLATWKAYGPQAMRDRFTH